MAFTSMFLAANIARVLSQPLMIFVVLCNVMKNFLDQFFFAFCKFPKFAGKVIHCLHSSICIFPFPISINSFAKFSTDASHWSFTRMLVIKINFCKWRHKTEDLRHALSSSPGVAHGITGRVWPKPPDNKVRRSASFLLNLLDYDRMIPMLFCETLYIRPK